jgi:hypothetical protein
MNKLEVGKYIRTKDGYLHQILGISEQTGRPYHTDKTNLGNYIELNNISKVEDNIEYLLKIGDYVNGEYVDLFSLEHYRKNPKNIKTIVTKEHFKSIEYRLGE